MKRDELSYAEIGFGLVLMLLCSPFILIGWIASKTFLKNRDK
jgi:hypothetical protein